MQVGDLVQVTGVVKDIVTAKDTGVVNVLVGADPDGKEYWFQNVHVASQTKLTAAEEAEAAKEHPPSSSPPPTTARGAATTTRHSS